MQSSRAAYTSAVRPPPSFLAGRRKKAATPSSGLASLAGEVLDANARSPVGATGASVLGAVVLGAAAPSGKRGVPSLPGPLLPKTPKLECKRCFTVFARL